MLMLEENAAMPNAPLQRRPARDLRHELLDNMPRAAPSAASGALDRSDFP
jgi:hypothetical protein